MKQSIDTLHLLTPLSCQIPTEMAATNEGDLIVDLRGFPIHIYQAKPNQTWVKITGVLPLASDYWTIARDWLLAFTEKTELQRVLAIEGYGFWWSLSRHHFAPTLSDVGNSFAWIDMLDAVTHTYLPEHIIIYGQHSALIHLMEQIFGDAQFRLVPETPHRPKTWYQPTLNFSLIAIRAVIGLFYFLYATIWPNDVYIFSTTNLLRRIRIGLKQQLRDLYQADLPARLRAKGWRVGLLETYGWNASWQGIIARGLFFPTDIIFLLSRLSLTKLGPYRDLVDKWRCTWDDVEPKLDAHLTYRNYDITPLVKPLLVQTFIEVAPSLQLMVGLWRRILRLWRPKLLYLVSHSYGRSLMTAVIAAKSLGIPTIEQQHGTIGKNHFAYLIPEQLETQSKFPLCDRMVVWGEQTQRLLVGSYVYLPEQIAVCGFPRLDLLLKELPPKEQTLAVLAIPSEASVALYTSNLVAEGAIIDIVESVAKVSPTANLYWIIKLHPAEKTRHKWDAAIRQHQLRSVRVVESEFDFYTLLAACDVHISFASTTIIEAAALGKINFGLDIEAVPDPIGYAEAKGFLPVDPSYLGTTVWTILNDPVRKEQLWREQQQFADDWCLHDGKSVERIVQFVGKVLESKN